MQGGGEDEHAKRETPAVSAPHQDRDQPLGERRRQGREDVARVQTAKRLAHSRDLGYQRAKGWRKISAEAWLVEREVHAGIARIRIEAPIAERLLIPQRPEREDRGDQDNRRGKRLPCPRCHHPPQDDEGQRQRKRRHREGPRLESPSERGGDAEKVSALA